MKVKEIIMEEDFCGVCGRPFPLDPLCSTCWGWAIMIELEVINEIHGMD